LLKGIKFKATPSSELKIILSQWMGCARVIYNAKCDEEKYLSTFARKYLSVGTYAPVDQKYSHYKSELTPWLSECPSQVLRNSAVNWYSTYQKFLKGQCGKPKRKVKTDSGSCQLTRELFRFRQDLDGVTRLYIGTVKNEIGYLPVKFHKKFWRMKNAVLPASIRIKKVRGNYTVSFCYENGISDADLFDDKEHLAHLKESSFEFLNKFTLGIDRGVTRPVQAGDSIYDFTSTQKRKKLTHEVYVKRLQRRLARQKKGSNRYKKTKHRMGNRYAAVANIRQDFCHKTSRSIVDGKEKVFIFEDLKTKNMTKSAKGSIDNPGRNVKQKSGLNKVILDKSWHQLETFTKYKSKRAGKAFFKVSAKHTSQECAACSHIHPDNRTTQSEFRCGSCGHTDNADRNAALVIKKRAILLIQDSGTELSDRGVLVSDRGRGARRKSTPILVLQKAMKRQKRKNSSDNIAA
jgi:putative transposase